MSDLHITIALYHQLERRVDEAEQKLSLAKAEYDRAQQLQQLESNHLLTTRNHLLDTLQSLQAEEPLVYQQVKAGVLPEALKEWQGITMDSNAIKQALYMGC